MKEINKKIKKLKIKFSPEIFYLLQVTQAIPWPVPFKEIKETENPKIFHVRD